MALRNNNLHNNLKCSIFFVRDIPGLCPSMPLGWGTLGQLTLSCNFRFSTKTVHVVRSLMYWACTQQHWWSVCRLLNTWVKYLGSKCKIYETCPSVLRFPLQKSGGLARNFLWRAGEMTVFTQNPNTEMLHDFRFFFTLEFKVLHKFRENTGREWW